MFNISERDELVAKMMAAIYFDSFDDPSAIDPDACHSPRPGDKEMAVGSLGLTEDDAASIDWRSVEIAYSEIVEKMIFTSKLSIYKEGESEAESFYAFDPEILKTLTAGQIQVAARDTFYPIKLKSEHSYELLTAGFVNKMIELCGLSKE